VQAVIAGENVTYRLGARAASRPELAAVLARAHAIGADLTLSCSRWRSSVRPKGRGERILLAHPPADHAYR
jgi:hypothetical protein